MSLQLLQGAFILAIELGWRHFSSVHTACELLAVFQRVLFLRAQRHTGSRGCLGTFSPLRVADPMRIAIRSEAGDLFLEERSAPEP
ncbi:hypothetical protein AO398_24500 [Methylobacterium sp. GXS13]|uniref:hypothetical protein n=1 Tax=Methylobacterium sp. GXS13 TaxID=1730094 RepID=UPI00071BAF78|nr:hypothetical protein [Methylobacterium sp. GXS13]KST57607.1 hypothetical protein AO398_24500 [Methylobacterium sp. GXS13]